MAKSVAAPSPSKHRDPWWDLEGKGVRRGRRTRMTVELVAFALALAALWVAIYLQLYA